MSSNLAHDESFSKESFMTEKNRTFRSSSCEAKKPLNMSSFGMCRPYIMISEYELKKQKNIFSTSILLMVEKHKLVHVIFDHKFLKNYQKEKLHLRKSKTDRVIIF